MDFKMKKIAVFYHAWAPEHSSAWCLLVDEQIKNLIQSNLRYNAKIFCCINSKQANIIKNYIEQYDFIEILECSEDERQYEAFTLKHLYDFCKTNENYDHVLYFHTKGIRHFSHTAELNVIKNVNSWRRFLEYGTITKWRECIAMLQAHDVAGINFHLHPRKHFQGNFWWATSQYIKTLESPLSNKFADESFCHPNAIDRVSCEMWIGSGNPKWFSIYNYPFGTGNDSDSFDLYKNDIFPYFLNNSY